MDRISASIRDIVDFPKPGIVFKDITPMMRDPALMRHVTEELARPFRHAGVTAVMGMEARGFIFCSLVAAALGVGFIPLRKPGKLPYSTHQVSYDLEYGSSTVELHIDAVKPGDRVLLLDDLLATGGTASAAVNLLKRIDAKIMGVRFLVELGFLNGREKLACSEVRSVIQY